MSSVRNSLLTLDRTTSQASIRLSRLLRIADGIFGGKVGRLPWAKPTAPASGPRRPIRAAVTTPRLSSHVVHQYRRLPDPSGRSRPSAVSLPSRGMRPRSQRLAPPQHQAPAAPADGAKTRPRHTNLPVGRKVRIPSLISSRSHRTPATHSMALETIVQLIASRLSGYGKTFGKSRSLSGHVRSTRLGSAVPIAPVGQSCADSEPRGVMTQPANTWAGAVSAPSVLQASTRSRPKTARSNHGGIQDDNRKKIKTNQGDLYLEDSILGRWLTQHLTREITRPRAGTLAVDPRIAPVWGGPSLPT